jgi:steroid delta-isomerase-like uncharacterized protein
MLNGRSGEATLLGTFPDGIERTEEKSMDIEANKDLVRTFGEAINSANWEALDDILTDDFQRHCQATPDVTVKSAEEFKALQRSFLETFPDQRLDPEVIVAEGDRVGFMGTYSGTHLGRLGDIPPTGNKAKTRAVGFFRIEGGRIAELWVEWDNISFLSQLGLFPPPAGG